MRTEAEKEMWGKQVIKVDGKYISYYRYLIENKIGRKLLSTEVIHHINFNHSDNRIENLELMTNKEHSSFHGKLRNIGKEHASFFIEDNVLKEFKMKIKEKCINQSAWINLKMEEFIRDNKEKEGKK